MTGSKVREWRMWRVVILRIRPTPGGSGTTHQVIQHDSDGRVQRTLRLSRHRAGWTLQYAHPRRNV